MHSWQDIPTMDVAELAQRLQALPAPGDSSGDPHAPTLQLIDVREREEVALVALPGFTVLPLSESGQWVPTIGDRFDPHAETVVMCHHGGRSAQMCQWLMAQGFTQVKNLTGGIDAYAARVDPTLPRY